MARLVVSNNVFAVLMLAFSVSADNENNKSPQIHIGLPYSTRKGFIQLSEDTQLNSLVAIMEVKDEDSGPAGQVDCRADNEYIGLVMLAPNTYKVNLMALLDREAHTQVEVRITCMDRGSPSSTSTANFTVEVMDVNDNAPYFMKTEYKASLMEGVAIGTLVLRAKATDPDEGENGQIEFSLLQDTESDTSPFSIDKNSGKIYTNIDIDRETVSEYELTVLATDYGRPPLTSSVKVIITVEDVNDNRPVILNNELHTRENQKPMSLVGTVKAMDLDAGENAELVFSKVEDDQFSSTSPFLVESNGNILAAVSLDREKRSHYQLVVTVRDSGKPPMNNTGTINIIVDDVNDNSPQIVSSCLYDDTYEVEDDDDEDSNEDYAYAIFNTTVSSGFISIDWYSPEDDRTIYQVVGTDKDSGDNGKLSYAIESVTVGDALNITSNNDLLFQIDEDTGEISLRRYLRPSDSLVQIVNVSVKDRGIPSHSVFCALNITLEVDITQLTTPMARKVDVDANSNSNSRQNSADNGASSLCTVSLTNLLFITISALIVKSHL